MRSEVIRPDDWTCDITVRVPESELPALAGRASIRIAGGSVAPRRRRGRKKGPRYPAALLRSRWAAGVLQDRLGTFVVEVALRDAAKAEGIEPVAPVQNVVARMDGAELVIDATIYALPDRPLEWPEFDLPTEPKPVTDEDVDRLIHEMCARRTTWRDASAVAEGDVVEVEVTTIDRRGQPEPTRSEAWVWRDTGSPEAERVKTMRPGDEAEFSVTTESGHEHAVCVRLVRIRRASTGPLAAADPVAQLAAELDVPAAGIRERVRAEREAAAAEMFDRRRARKVLAQLREANRLDVPSKVCDAIAWPQLPDGLSDDERHTWLMQSRERLRIEIGHAWLERRLIEENGLAGTDDDARALADELASRIADELGQDEATVRRRLMRRDVFRTLPAKAQEQKLHAFLLAKVA